MKFKNTITTKKSINQYQIEPSYKKIFSVSESGPILLFRDCEALRDMMENLVYQVSLVKQDLQAIQRTQR